MNDLRLLEFAIALDRHRNFGRAADALGVTQPTFSRGIAALETQLGARLFERTNRRVELTPVGNLVLTRARTLVADAEAIRDVVGDYRNLRSGRVVVGVGPYPLDLSVIESVVRLVARHPLLQIEIIEGQWRDFGPRLLAGEIEVAVMDTSLVEPDSRFKVEPLPVHRGCFYCRPGHPLAGRAALQPSDIVQYPLVGVRLPPRIMAPPPKGVPGFSIDPATGDVTPHITMTSVAASRAVVKRTDGIGIAAPVQIADDVRQGTLAILDVDAGDLRTRYGITCLRERNLSPGAQAFLTVLREVEAELAADPAPV
jgi:DNA-binding transcriptional LysR family regulator